MYIALQMPKKILKMLYFHTLVVAKNKLINIAALKRRMGTIMTTSVSTKLNDLGHAMRVTENAT
jgi:hypothetical protein